MIRNSEPRGGDSGNKREQKSRAQMMAEIHAASLRGESKDGERSDNLQEAQDDVGKIAVEDTVVAQFHGSVDGIPIKGDGQFFQSMGITPTPAEEEDKAQNASSNDDNEQTGEPEEVAGRAMDIVNKARGDSTMKPQKVKLASNGENRELVLSVGDAKELLGVNQDNVSLSTEVMKRLQQSDQVWQDLEKKDAELRSQDVEAMSEVEQNDWEKQTKAIKDEISDRKMQLAYDTAGLIHDFHEKDSDANYLVDQWKKEQQNPVEGDALTSAGSNIVRALQKKMAENDPVIARLKKGNEAKGRIGKDQRDSAEYYQALHDRQDALMIAAAEKVYAFTTEDPYAYRVMYESKTLTPVERQEKFEKRAKEFFAPALSDEVKPNQPNAPKAPETPKTPKSPESENSDAASLYEQLAAIAAQQDPETIAILNDKNLSDENN
jgi:hypothetical protein